MKLTEVLKARLGFTPSNPRGFIGR